MIRVLATALGALAFVVAASALVSRYLPVSHETVLVLAAASPYLTAAVSGSDHRGLATTIDLPLDPTVS